MTGANSPAEGAREGLVLRNVFSGVDQIMMERFWDSSAKFAIATSFIAKQVPGLNREEAYTYGLFQNCGIPILMQRFPEYKSTLTVVRNPEPDRPRTAGRPCRSGLFRNELLP